MDNKTSNPSVSEAVDVRLRAQSPEWARAWRSAIISSSKAIALPIAVWSFIAAACFVAFLVLGHWLDFPGISWEQLSALTGVVAGTAATFSAIVAAFSVFLYGTASSSIQNAHMTAAPALRSIRSTCDDLLLFLNQIHEGAPASLNRFQEDTEYFRFTLLRIRSEFTKSEHHLMCPDVSRLALLQMAAQEAAFRWYKIGVEVEEKTGAHLSEEPDFARTRWLRSSDDVDLLVRAGCLVDRASGVLSTSRSFSRFFVGFALVLLLALFMKLTPPMSSTQAETVNLAIGVGLVTFFAAVLCHMAFSVVKHMTSEHATASAYQTLDRIHADKIDSEYLEKDLEYVRAHQKGVAKALDSRRARTKR